MAQTPRHRGFSSRPAEPATPPAGGLDFEMLRGRNAPQTLQITRLTITILSVLAAAVLLGGWYFIHTMLRFKTSALLTQTAILGPYPNEVVIYVTIPILGVLLYVFLDYFKIKTGLHPFKTPQGIGVTVLAFSLFWAISGLPGTLIKHETNAFAAAHGYEKCSSLFDPQHIRVYALSSYVESYGCPTAAPPP